MHRAFATALLCGLLAACASTPDVRAPVSVAVTAPPPVKLGIALGGGQRDVQLGIGNGNQIAQLSEGHRRKGEGRSGR